LLLYLLNLNLMKEIFAKLKALIKKTTYLDNILIYVSRSDLCWL
jgi:hypothetical protein